MVVYCKCFCVEDIIGVEMLNFDLIEEVGLMYSEIMVEFCVICVQMVKGIVLLFGSVVMVVIDVLMVQELVDVCIMFEIYWVQIEQCEKFKIEFDFIYDVIDCIKCEIVILYGKSFDGGEMVKVNGEFGVVVGGIEQVIQQIFEVVELID